MVSIAIEHAVKLFGQVRAVDDVSLQIERGELFFLLGPSGCGKTTLLRMIAGFYYPDEGRILFDGRDTSQVPPHARHTGMVFQNYALWPHMSVRDNLAFGLEMHRVPPTERRKRVEQALDMVQMREYGDRLPNQLSGGQQQRVAVARALVLEPDVVLLDEPLSNLDAKLRLEMRAQIKSLHERLDLTMVYVTHDQAEALSMADRLAIMRQGRISQMGAPREVYHRPHSRFVAGFIGETNLIQGRIRTTDAPTTVDTPAGPLISSVLGDGIHVGDEVHCSIRPEHLEVLKEGESAPNVLAGEVVQTFFLGNHEQYFLRLADGAELRAIEFDVDTPRAAVGQTARLGCNPENVVVLRDEE